MRIEDISHQARLKYDVVCSAYGAIFPCKILQACGTWIIDSYYQYETVIDDLDFVDADLIAAGGNTQGRDLRDDELRPLKMIGID